MPTLAHRIRLDPTPDQIRVFKQAVGTARFVWNWAPAEWNRQYEAGQQSNATALKPPFNAIQYEQFPWLHEVPRDAHAQPFADLAGAWQPYWEALKQRRERPTPSARTPRLRWDRPTFKKKGQARDSFYVANGKFHLVDRRVKLPQIGVGLPCRTPCGFPVKFWDPASRVRRISGFSPSRWMCRISSIIVIARGTASTEPLWA